MRSNVIGVALLLVFVVSCARAYQASAADDVLVSRNLGSLRPSTDDMLVKLDGQVMAWNVIDGDASCVAQ